MNQLYCSPKQFLPGCGSKQPRKLYSVPFTINGRRVAAVRLCASCLKKYKIKKPGK